MSEYKNLSKEQLELITLKSESYYLQGCLDTLRIIDDLKDTTLKFYQNKLDEINRLLEVK